MAMGSSTATDARLGPMGVSATRTISTTRRMATSRRISTARRISATGRIPTAGRISATRRIPTAGSISRSRMAWGNLPTTHSRPRTQSYHYSNSLASGCYSVSSTNPAATVYSRSTSTISNRTNSYLDSTKRMGSSKIAFRAYCNADRTTDHSNDNNRRS